jgi:hypothetical protein
MLLNVMFGSISRNVLSTCHSVSDAQDQYIRSVRTLGRRIVEGSPRYHLTVCSKATAAGRAVSEPRNAAYINALVLSTFESDTFALYPTFIPAILITGQSIDTNENVPYSDTDRLCNSVQRVAPQTPGLYLLASGK